MTILVVDSDKKILKKTHFYNRFILYMFTDLVEADHQESR